jgi:hypothetical protein
LNLLWYHALRREPYVDFPGLEEVVGKRIFLCVTSVVLCVSVVEFTAKTFTTEAQRLHREPQRLFFRQIPKRATEILAERAVTKLSAARGADFICSNSQWQPLREIVSHQGAKKTNRY